MKRNLSPTESHGISLKIFIVFIGFIVQSSVLFFLLRLCFLGIEFTDEGKYFNDSRSPGAFRDQVTHYGFVYHPIFKAIDFNVPVFRIINLLITFFLAYLVSFQSLRKLSKLSTINLISVSISIGLFSLCFLSVNWLPTPSYNSLTLQSLLAFWVSFEYYRDKRNQRSKKLAHFYLAATSNLVLLAKPTSFLLLSFIFFSYLFFTANSTRRVLLEIIQHVLLVTLGILTISFLFYGSPFQLLSGLYQGSQNVKLLGGKSLTVGRVLDGFKFNFIEAFSVIFTLVVIIAQRLVLSYGKSNLTKRIKNFSGAFYFISIILIGLYFVMSTISSLYLVLIPLSLAYMWVCLHQNSGSSIGIANYTYLLLMFPFVGAVGSANNLISHSKYFFFFVILFFFMVIVQRIKYNENKFLLHSLSFGLIFLLNGALYNSVNYPYRQYSSLLANSYEMSNSSALRNLKVNFENALQYKVMMKEVRKSGFQEGDGVIDLTGQSPLILFLIGAKPIGDSWLLGGYQGSNELAIKKLNQENCMIKNQSFLLIEKGGPRSLSVSYILNETGLSKNEYVSVATWDPPLGAGGYLIKRELSLLKPSRRVDLCS